jgi:hypothetical protein
MPPGSPLTQTLGVMKPLLASGFGRSLLLAAVLLPQLSACYNHAERERGLLERAEQTTGTIRHLNCANHGAMYYRFSVAGKEYAGPVDISGMNCGSTRVGDPVRVFYDPVDPRIHTLREPSSAYDEARGWYMPAWAVFAVAFAALILIPVIQSKVEEEKFSHNATRRRPRNDA